MDHYQIFRSRRQRHLFETTCRQVFTVQFWIWLFRYLSHYEISLSAHLVCVSDGPGTFISQTGCRSVLYNKGS